MKRGFIFFCLIWTVLTVSPLCFYRIQGLPSAELVPQAPIQTDSLSDNNTQANGFLPTALSVYITSEDKIISMDTEEYIWGVVAAEMPASFHEEALKAQAVAARTYLANRLQTKNEKHPDAHICTDSTHCQGWCSRTDARAKWVGDADFYENKLNTALSETREKILLYEEKPILAAYHALSSGKTNDAVDVWGKKVPYLVSVPVEEDRLREKYYFEVRYPKDALCTLLGEHGYPITSISDIGTPVYNDAGYMLRIGIGEKSVSGADLRNLLALRSAAVTIVRQEDAVLFQTRGYGHGVGMSQYGADSLGKNGKSFLEILSYFYPGTTLIPE